MSVKYSVWNNTNKKAEKNSREIISRYEIINAHFLIFLHLFYQVYIKVTTYKADYLFDDASSYMKIIRRESVSNKGCK